MSTTISGGTVPDQVNLYLDALKRRRVTPDGQPAQARDGVMIEDFAPAGGTGIVSSAPPTSAAPVSGEPVEFDQNPRQHEDRLDYIKTVYQEELGRDADEEGLNYWANSGLEGDDLIKQMRTSAGLDNTLYEDAALSKFMRTYNQRRGTIDADLKQRTSEIERNRKLSQSVLDRQQGKGLRNINNAAEAQGMYRSGGRHRKRGELVTDIGINRANVDQSAATQADKARQAAIKEQAQLSRNRDEQEIEARKRLTRKSIQDAM